MKPVSSPPALKHGPGRHDKNHSANGNYAVLILGKAIHQKWADRSFHFQGQCPCTPGCLWTWNQMNLCQRPGKTIEMSLWIMTKLGFKVPFQSPAARFILALSFMSYDDWNQASCFISSSWNFITFKTIAKWFPSPWPHWELNKAISTRFFGF